MNIDSVQIVPVPVSDQDRSRRFYADQLGLPLLVDHDAGGGMRWIQFGFPAGGASVTLVADGAMPPGSLVGLVMETSDIERCVEALTARGVEFPTGIQDMPWARTAAFADPDGNQLVLQTPLRPVA